MFYPSAQVHAHAGLAYSYDALNRLSKVCDNRLATNCGAAGLTTYSYDAVGNLSGYVYPNTVQTANAFDTQNRLTQTCEAASSPACTANQKLASYAYTLGNAGNRTNVAELGGRSVTYGYDNDYRLMSESIASDPAGNNGSENYTYDTVGNRLTLNSTIPSLPGAITYSYDANDRLSSDGYDANGNTTSSAGISNTYDFENKMTAHGAAAIAYDGDGNRVSETVGSTTTKFLVDEKKPTGYSQVMDELVNGAVTRTYTYGRQLISENQLIGSNWTPSFYGYDGHGNTRFLANTAGTVTDTYTYDAFGMPIASTGTTANNFHYSGEWLDPNLSFYNLRARYYNPLAGRFLSQDPEDGNITDPKTLHRYLYTGGDPVNGWDPTGREEAVSYLLFGSRDLALTFAKTAVVSGVVDCLLEFSLSKFDGAIEAAWNGGSISQVGPCVWIFTNLQKAVPQPQAPAQPVAGTKLSPWTPQCDELKAAVDAAKTVANSLGKCTKGMSPWQLQVRYDAWVGLGARGHSTTWFVGTEEMTIINKQMQMRG